MILLSHVLDGNTPTYGNRDSFIIEEVSQIRNGDTANSSKWTFSSNHLGTHIDMPLHFFDKGKSVTDIEMDLWKSTKVQLIDLPLSNAKLIEVDDLNIYDDTEVLLLRTGFERYRNTDKYWNDNPGISEDVGIWIRRNRPNVRIIGFDFISITSWKYRLEGRKAHKAFLDPETEGGSICIIEDMTLCKASSALKSIIIAPLFVKGANGGPVTIFANYK